MADVFNFTHTSAEGALSRLTPVFDSWVGPEIYECNPFRRLGLPVVASAREVARRVDQLKLAIELDGGRASWSFAPTAPLRIDEIREAAQTLKNPAARLVHEFFWFWPEDYPETGEPDPAIEHLARGETEEAVRCWQAAAPDGSLAALHNLAVYHHQQALALERQDAPSDEELVRIWFKALRHWGKLGENETLWTRLKHRVVLGGDAQVTEESVDQMRAGLPDALARICASIALDHAAQGRTDRASLHAAFVTHIHGETPAARRVLESCAAPVMKRIEARAAEARKRGRGDPEGGRPEVLALLRSNHDDLQLVETLCGRGSEYRREVSQTIVDAALELLVAYQRVTYDDRGCLPLLVHLLGMDATPELRGRVADTFEIMSGNAIADDGDAALNAAEVLRRRHQLFVETIVPGAREVGLGEVARQACATCVAGMLNAMADEAAEDADDCELAMEVLATALELPCSLELRDALKEHRSRLEEELNLRRERELRIEVAGVVVQIDRRGIGFGDSWVAPDELVAFRCGSEWVDDGAATSYVVAWRSVTGAEFELNRSNVFADTDRAEERYARIVESFYFFLGPALIARLAQAVCEGEKVFLGGTPLRREGVLLRSDGRFWKREAWVPYAEIETSIVDGRLTLSSKRDPRLSDVHDVANTWNAALIGYVVEALARENS